MAALSARLNAKELKNRLDKVFSTFPSIAARRHQKAASLSGGEQQQVALSKALLLDPAVLCIDELSLGLAPLVVGELLEIVQKIHEAGVTLIVVEQSLNIASEICERAVFLEKGEVRFEGPTRDLLARDDIARAVFLGANCGRHRVIGLGQAARLDRELCEVTHRVCVRLAPDTGQVDGGAHNRTEQHVGVGPLRRSTLSHGDRMNLSKDSARRCLYAISQRLVTTSDRRCTRRAGPAAPVGPPGVHGRRRRPPPLP